MFDLAAFEERNARDLGAVQASLRAFRIHLAARHAKPSPECRACLAFAGQLRRWETERGTASAHAEWRADHPEAYARAQAAAAAIDADVMALAAGNTPPTVVREKAEQAAEAAAEAAELARAEADAVRAAEAAEREHERLRAERESAAVREELEDVADGFEPPPPPPDDQE